MPRWIACVTLAVSLSLGAGAAVAQSPSSLEVVRVHTTAGEVLPGFILERRDDGFVLRSDGEDLFIAWKTVEHLETIGEAPSQTAPAPAPLATPLIAPGPRGLRAAYRHDDALSAYDSTRLLLRDKKNHALGPARLGYSKSDFEDDDDYFIATLGEASAMTIPEFVQRTGDTELRRKFDQRRQKLEIQGRAGWAFVGAGAATGATGITLFIAGLNSGDSQAASAGGPMIGWSVASAVFGAFLHGMADKERRRLAGQRLDEVFLRPEAWDAAQAYNSRLRAEYDLPDDERLDASDD